MSDLKWLDWSLNEGRGMEREYGLVDSSHSLYMDENRRTVHIVCWMIPRILTYIVQQGSLPCTIILRYLSTCRVSLVPCRGQPSCRSDSLASNLFETFCNGSYLLGALFLWRSVTVGLKSRRLNLLGMGAATGDLFSTPAATYVNDLHARVFLLLLLSSRDICF